MGGREQPAWVGLLPRALLTTEEDGPSLTKVGHPVRGNSEYGVTGYGTVWPVGGTQLVRFILGDEGFYHAAHLFSADCLDILIKQPFT